MYVQCLTAVNTKYYHVPLHVFRIDGSVDDGSSFFVLRGGHETTASAMSWALHELAQHQDIQDNLLKEIEQYMEKYNGEITYETMEQMEYLDKVFKETLRKYPAGPLIMRVASSDYTFETLNFTVPKYTNVWVSVYNIQRDPAIYPDPMKFDPERFTKEAEATRHPMHFMPFGEGPRHCIGYRFAIFNWKLGIFTILRDYKVETCEQTVLSPEFEPWSFLLTPKSEIKLKLTKIS
ncbi:cytochrome P450 6B4-like [Augochlora pura]